MNKELQYEFVLEIHRVHLTIDFPCNVQIWWRKGKGKIITEKPIPIRGKEPFFDVNEPLSIRGNCHLRNGHFAPKISQIQIVLIPADTTLKSGGSVELDMASILNSAFINRPTSLRFQKELNGIPKGSSAKVSFTLSARFLRECTNTSAQDISFQDASLRRNGRSFHDRIAPQTIIRDNLSVGNRISSYKDITFRSPEHKVLNQYQSEYKDYHQPKAKPQYFNNQYGGGKTPAPSVRPLEFSFNPVDNSERKDQKEKINELTRQLEECKREMTRLRSLQGQPDLLNQLQALRREKVELVARNKEQMRLLQSDTNEKNRRALFICEQKNKQLMQRNEGIVRQMEGRKKEVETKQRELEGKMKQIEELKREGFKRQSQLLAYEEKLQSEGNSRQWQQRYKKLEGQVQKERELMRSRERQQEAVLHEIQKEMGMMRGGKEQVQLLRDKLSSACRRIDELTARESAWEETGRRKEKEVEEMVGRLRAQIKSRDDLIEQAKVYVREKEQEVEQRDQFIVRAKEYIQQKESDFESERAAWQGEGNDKRVEELEGYVEGLHEKISISQDEIQELVRKTRSQQETLEELVQKNLQMEIQLNVRQLEIDTIKRNH